MAWKPATNAASERKGFSTALAMGAVITLKFELHPIVGDFEAGIQHGAVFGAFFVKDGVRIVDVNQGFAAFGTGGKLFKQTVGARERQMANLARGLFAAAGAHQFVVAPEGAINESHIGGLDGGLPHCGRSGKRGSKKETLFALFHDETDRRVFRRNGAKSFLADVIRITSSKRHGAADEVCRPRRIFRQMAAQTSFGRQRLPFHRRIGALQHAENPILFLKYTLDAARRKNKEALKLSQMEQPHHRIHISARQKHTANRRWRRSTLWRGKFARAKHLLAQIRRSGKQKPHFGINGENDLRLRARTSFQFAVAQSTTVRTITIPLGKAAPGCRSEDFYTHSSTPASLLARRTECLELGVRVGADFAVEVNLFVPRGGPFHGNALLKK